MTTETYTAQQVINALTTACELAKGPNSKLGVGASVSVDTALRIAEEWQAAQRTRSNQPAPDTGEWRVVAEPIHGWGVVSDTRKIVGNIYCKEDAEQIASDHNSVSKLAAALKLILSEAEYVADAKAPFSTWVAENCRAALAAVGREDEQ